MKATDLQEQLDPNVVAYHGHLNDLLATDAGKYVVIGHGRLVGVEATYEAALTVGYEKFKRGPFFVSRIIPLEEERMDFHEACPR